MPLSREAMAEYQRHRRANKRADAGLPPWVPVRYSTEKERLDARAATVVRSRARAKSSVEHLDAPISPSPLRSAIHKKQEELAGRPRPLHCEVCKKRPVQRGKQPIVWDHDHSTGTFRGWLCFKCNAALGMVRDCPETLRALADYLETTQIRVDKVNT